METLPENWMTAACSALCAFILPCKWVCFSFAALWV